LLLDNQNAHQNKYLAASIYIYIYIYIYILYLKYLFRFVGYLKDPIKLEGSNSDTAAGDYVVQAFVFG
jgi:hypothetical protein